MLSYPSRVYFYVYVCKSHIEPIKTQDIISMALTWPSALKFLEFTLGTIFKMTGNSQRLSLQYVTQKTKQNKKCDYSRGIFQNKQRMPIDYVLIDGNQLLEQEKVPEIQNLRRITPVLDAIIYRHYK